MNSGTITGTGGTAIEFGSPGTLTLTSTSVINGTVMGEGSTLQFGGSSAGFFDVSALGTSALYPLGPQYEDFDVLNKIDSSTWILVGTNALVLPVNVEDGALVIDASMPSASVAVDAGATFGGKGTIGGLIVNSGATLAPSAGTPFSTLNVVGAASLAAGSTFAVNINPAGQSDKLVTAGATTLSGGTVAVNGASGTHLPSTHYTLMTAQGGVSGTFSSLSTSGNLAALAFLDPMLSYDADDVYLGFAVEPFTSVAQTTNQAATALALQAQPVGSPLYNALIDQTAAGALTAFNALSGEIHASAVGAALDDTRPPREAVLDRLAEAYGEPPPSGAKSVKTYDFSTPGQVFSAWGQAFELLGACRRQRQRRNALQWPRRLHSRRRRDVVRPISPRRRWRLHQCEPRGGGAWFVR